MKTWEPKRPVGKWRGYLTAEELAVVQSAERDSQAAREALAAATAILNPIRQRAAHRALAAERAVK